jgi:hypothetical protein
VLDFAAMSTLPMACVASWMNAMAISTKGTTMMRVTAAVLMEAAMVLPNRASSRCYRAKKNAAKIAAHASGTRKGRNSR